MPVTAPVVTCTFVASSPAVSRCSPAWRTYANVVRSVTFTPRRCAISCWPTMLPAIRSSIADSACAGVAVGRSLVAGSTASSGIAGSSLMGPLSRG